MAKKKSRQYKARDLSAAKPKRGGGHNDDGSRKGGVTPAFRAGIVNGVPFLLTRNGRRVDLRTHAGRPRRQVSPRFRMVVMERWDF